MDKYTHNIKIVANTSLIAGTTIYSGRFVNRGSYTIDNLVALAKEKTDSVSESDIRAFITAIFTVAKKWCQNNVWLGTFCGLRFRPSVTGSFPAIDSEWNDSVNKWNLEASFVSDITSALEDTEPHIITTDDEVLLVLKREGDVATDTPNVVVKGDDFILTGNNMYLGRTGEGLELVNGTNAWKCTLAIDNGPTSKTFYVFGTNSHPLPTKGFQGYLRMSSYGKDRTGGAIMTDVKNVSFMPKTEETALSLPYTFSSTVGLNKIKVSDEGSVGNRTNFLRIKGTDSANVDLYKIRWYDTTGTEQEEPLDGELNADSRIYEFSFRNIEGVTPDFTKPATIFSTMFSGTAAELANVTLVA